MRYLFRRYVFKKWYVFLMLGMLTWISCAYPDIMTDKSRMNNGLMKLFGGVSYNPDLKEMGFPLHYLILLFEITLWIGVSSVEEYRTKGCGELL